MANVSITSLSRTFASWVKFWPFEIKYKFVVT